MIFSLDVRPAHKGDCLIVHYGSEKDPGLMIIDGGPAQVYKPHLKPRLERIRRARGLKDDERLLIDILMVSHIDDDHINGILEMTEEILAAGRQRPPVPVRALSVWHNALHEIIQNTPKALTGAVTAQFGAASLSGDPETDGLDETAAKVLASVSQGVRLRENVEKLNWSVNSEFDSALVQAQTGAEPLELDRGLTLTVAGPMEPELSALQSEYKKFLEKREEERKRKEVLASFTDKSIPNLSSIVVVAELGKKTMLLTGDARGDKILKGLEMVGCLKFGGNMHVDILKVPHHGSNRNIEPIFFRRIAADHYVFSGDGEHGNPERETLKMLLDERPNEAFAMHFTYPIATVDKGRREDWGKGAKEGGCKARAGEKQRQG